MLVEADADRAVIWTKPDDLEYDPDMASSGLGSLRRNGFQILLADGSVRFVSNGVAAGVLKALFTSRGGEKVPRDF